MKFHVHFRVSILIFLVVMGLGSFGYQRLEGWDYLDSIYFVVVTVTTIGYGDLVPQTDMGKIFTIFFSFLGIASAFYFVSLLGRYIFEKHGSINFKNKKINK